MTSSKSFGESRVRVRMDGSTPSDPSLEKQIKKRSAQTSAYQKYKESLHAFFDGEKPLPKKVQEMLDTRDDDDAPKKEVSKKSATGAQKKRKNRNPKSDRLMATSDSATGYHQLVENIRKAKSPREVENAIDALQTQKFTLPLEEDVLSKALSHSKERVMKEALEGLLKLSASDDLKGGVLLKTRIDNVALLVSSGEMRALCEGVKEKISTSPGGKND